MINYIKKQFKWSIQEIIISGFLVSIGMFIDAYLKIGNSKLMTMSIYILIGLILPLPLAIFSAFIMDSMSMLLQGLLSQWWWSMAFQPIILVIISFIIKVIFNTIKNKKIEVWINLLICLILIIGSIAYFSLYNNRFSLDLINKEKYIFQRNERLAQIYISLIGFIIISLMSFFIIFKNYKKIKHNNFFLCFSVILLSVIFIDWIYAPIAFMDFQMHSSNAYMNLDGKWNQQVYETIFYTYIMRSGIHMFVGILLVPSIYTIFENSSLLNNKNKH